MIQVNPTVYTPQNTNALSINLDASYNNGVATTTNVFFQSLTGATSYKVGGYSCTIRNATASDFSMQLALTVNTTSGTVSISNFVYHLFYFLVSLSTTFTMTELVYTVTYNMNSVGATTLPQETYYANTLVTLAASVQTNDPATAIDFWTDGSGTVRQPGSTLVLTQNITLTATYYNKYRVTYLTNNASASGTQSDTTYYLRNEQATIKDKGLIMTNDFTTMFTSWTEVGSNATRMPGTIVTMTADRVLNATYTLVLANTPLTYVPRTGTIRVFNSLKTQIMTFNNEVNLHGFIVFGPNRTAKRMRLTNSYYEKYYAPPKEETKTNDFFYVTTRILNASTITNHDETSKTSGFNSGTDTLVLKTSTAGVNQFVARNAALVNNILSAKIALDPAGNVYATGNHTIGTNLAVAYDSSGNAFNPVIDSNTNTTQQSNAHIVKYNDQGNILGILTIEGLLNNIIYDVFATSTNVYVGSRMDSNNNSITIRNGTFSNVVSANGQKGLIMKLTGVGNGQQAFVWVTGVATASSTDRAISVVVDASENVYVVFVASSVTSVPLFDTTNTVTPRYTAPLKTSNFVSLFVKYNSSGVLQWKGVVYSTSDTIIFTTMIAVDASGNGLVAFQCPAACELVDEFGTRKALQLPSGVTTGVFLVKVNSTGAFVSYNLITNATELYNMHYLDQYYYADCNFTGIVQTNAVTITDLPTPTNTFTQTGLFTATGNDGGIKIRFAASTMLPELIGYYTI